MRQSHEATEKTKQLAAKMGPINNEWNRYVVLTASMSHDFLAGKGCTKGAYISNLRMIADALEKLPSD